jgi:hypothetical protein
MGELQQTPSSKGSNGSTLENGQSKDKGVVSAGSYSHRPSRLLKVVNWWHIASVYMPAVQYPLLALLLAQLARQVSVEHLKVSLSRMHTHPTRVARGGSGIHPTRQR